MAGALVLIVLLVVGVPYVYIHFIEGDPPAPLSVDSLSTGTTAASSASTAATAPSPGAPSSGSPEGTYKVASGSQAGYRVGEVLFGQSTTAVGRTSAITGTVTIAGTSVSTGSFSVDMTKMSSDRSQRDGQFRGRIMDVSTYPTATFALTRPIDLGTIPAEGATVTETATGDLMLHGVTKSVTFPVTVKRNATDVAVSGSIPVVFADYSIDNPSGGPATTEDHGVLEFALALAHA